MLTNCDKSLRVCVKVQLYWPESESDVALEWIHSFSSCMFILDSDKDQREFLITRSLSFQYTM